MLLGRLATNKQQQAGLDDFLPGVRYHAVTDAALLRKLEHFQVTSLLVEGCFGDLDMPLFTHRHASVHHRSTPVMMERNRVFCQPASGQTAASTPADSTPVVMERNKVFQWFASQLQDRQQHLLQLTARQW